MFCSFCVIKMGCVCFISTFIFCICMSGISAGVTSKRTSSSSVLSDILDDLDLHSDNRVRPGYGGKPLEIQAFVFIRNIIEINEEKSTMTVNLLLMQMWNDPRLIFEGGGEGKDSISEILVDNPDFMSTFWNPDTFIINEVATDARYATRTSGSEGNLASQIIRLSRNGDVLKTSRITVAISCPMRFESYPLHSFDCDIDMESFGHKTDEILYMWRNGSRSVDLTKIDKTSLAGKSSYSLKYVTTHSQQTHLHSGGSYSRIIIRFHFKKLWLRHAITFFIPTALLTFCSLLSLWLIQRKYAEIGVIGNFMLVCLLVMLTALEYSTTPVLSRVPFLTPVDFHMGICLSTVFSSIAFHGVTLCCRNSKCIDNGEGKQVERRSKRQKRHVSQSTLAEEVDKILKTRRYVGSPKTTLGRVSGKLDDDEDISYYESYDVTGTDDVFADEEGETLGGEDEHQQHGNSDLTVEGTSCHKENANQKKLPSSKRKTLAWLITTLLSLSKWVSFLCFVSTECILWYIYGIGWSNGVSAVLVS